MEDQRVMIRNPMLAVNDTWNTYRVCPPDGDSGHAIINKDRYDHKSKTKGKTKTTPLSKCLIRSAKSTEQGQKNVQKD